MQINKQHIIIIFFIFLGILNLRAQEISLTINGFEGKAALNSVEGEKIIFIDSLKSENGIIFIESGNYDFHIGFYRVILGDKIWIDFIYNGDDVEIQTDINNVTDSLIIINSEDNELYYQFVRLNKNYNTKLKRFRIDLARYKEGDKFYAPTREKLFAVQKDYLEFVNKTSQANPNSFVARYIKSAQLPVLDLEMDPQKQINYLQSHSLDNVNFNDGSLIYSTLFPNKTIEYLMYYSNSRLTKDLVEVEFMKAVDTLLTKAKVNDLVYQQITEYLIIGFKENGLDNMLDYIIQNYVVQDDICIDEKLENSVQKRINQSKNLSVGAHAPNFEIQDASENTISLAGINSEKTLLIFYASWCPHCQTLLPEINMLYNNQTEKKLEVIAVSIDENKEDWLKFVNDNNLTWINVCDGFGWDGKLASKYSIYATPTMFLLDNEKKIISKPISIKELKKSLNH